MTDSMFVDHTAETAPEGSRAALRATETQFGFLPSAMARMAESPSVVAAFGRLMAQWDASSPDHAGRELATLTVAHGAGGEVCMAIPSAIVARSLADGAVLAALGDQTPVANPHLEAVRHFARVVLDTK